MSDARLPYVLRAHMERAKETAAAAVADVGPLLEAVARSVVDEALEQLFWAENAYLYPSAVLKLVFVDRITTALNAAYCRGYEHGKEHSNAQ